ncbi:ShlB/FhaC/HecB family hemolysin secretion/activation protein [Selenomonas ruminantium]|uniref:ShlB/FhaC/HecB family hemolysin secretion/activation protein n=1 Tax=Selenomonas ruminantium TaxID=971 RepID=UPI000944BB31|nr:ShlB/FhaC/HecB family hemolysin secretion/activation protein [Selenomonas ruminantium]
MLAHNRKKHIKNISEAVLLATVMGSIPLTGVEAAPPAGIELPQTTAGQLAEEANEKRQAAMAGEQKGKASVSVPDSRPELDLPDELKVEVKGFKVSGQDIFPEEKLLAVLDKRKNQLLSFRDLEAGADDLAAYFRDRGYVAVRVYLPVQKITNGIVEYAVEVGRFDKLTVRNHTTIHDSAVEREVRCLKQGEYLTKEKLQRAIWLLSDLAGADAKAVLSQGSEPGTVHVEIDLNKHKGKQGLVTVDNYGNRHTGYYELGVDYDFLNLAHEGDHFAVGGLLTGSHLYNYGFNYTIPVVTDGLRASLGYNVLSYNMGEEFSKLDAVGTARIMNMGLDYAIRRSQKNNLYVGARYEYSSIKDEYRAFANCVDDKYGHAGVLAFYGDETDHYGSTYWRVENKWGAVNYSTSGLTDGSTEGGYWKLKGNILRRQDLNPRLYLLLSARGQFAKDRLDSSERMSLGGFNGVRAYPTSEASGDRGYITRAELRYLIPLKEQDKQLQLATYFDHGGVLRMDKGGDSYRHLEGVGIGMILSRYEDWFIRTDYAWRLSPERPTSDTSSPNGHFWIRGGVYF